MDLDLEVEQAHRRRLAVLDPRVVVPELPQDGTVFRSGSAVAVATVTDTDLTGPAALWSHDRVHTLAVRCADHPSAAELGELLDQWSELVRADAAATQATTAMEVTLPSRDNTAVAALTRRHFTPASVLASRRRESSDHPSSHPVRPAMAADVERLVQLLCELHAYEERFGTVLERPDAEAQHRAGIAHQVATQPGWTWVAERDGQVVGVCAVAPPGQARWVTSQVSAEPAAYLSELAVQAGSRGAGIGSALAAAAHHQLDAHAVAVTLLHHGALNPLSTPFWARQGYLPLFTTFQRCPAFTPSGR